MFAFHGVDYMEIDVLFSDQEKLVRQTVREFVDQEIIPNIEEWNREGKFPRHLVPLMAELGFFGANLEGYGCAGMSNVEYGLLMQELERGDSGLRSFVSVQGALVMYPIHQYGSEEQKQRWLPALQQGKAIGCFGLTEPDFGSNPAGMRTRAVKDGDHYILNGEKAWITSGTIADVAVVWARTPEGIRGFLVEKGTPGYTSKRHQGQVVAARLGDLQPLAPGRSRARGPDASEGARVEGSFELFVSSALRHRLGSLGCGHGLLPRGTGIRQNQEAV